jgi:hypothetical protein
MKLNKDGLWVWPASLVAGFSLAYSTACHWFGFLLASKINRLVMLLAFGAIFSILSWLLVKRGSGYFSEKFNRRRFFLYLGAALVIAGAATFFIIPQQALPVRSLTTGIQILWTALKLADFVSLVGLLLFSGAILITIVSHWAGICRFFHRTAAASPTLGVVLVFCLFANLYISATDKAGTLHQLKPLPSNNLISLVWSKTYMTKARGYTLLFEQYQGWTLIAPAALLKKMKIDDTNALMRWGRLGTVVTADYLTNLSLQEMNDLLVLKNVKVQNGSGLQYIAVLEGDANRKICLRTYVKKVFFVPVALSPICESK